MTISIPIENLPTVGPVAAVKLKKLDINTLEDLIYHFPFRYEDYSEISSIAHVTVGKKLTISGIIWQIKNIKTKKGKILTIATVKDASGSIDIIWFNQPYLVKVLRSGVHVSLSGTVEFERYRPKLVSPSFEIIHNQNNNSIKRITYSQLNQNNNLYSTIHTGRLVSIYPETESLSSKWLRSKIAKFLPVYLKNNKDFMPIKVLQKHNLEKLNLALNHIHFPESYNQIERAKRRLGFDELFLIQLAAALRKKDWDETKISPKLAIDKKIIVKFIKNLPFNLTHAQEKVVNEILDDMQKDKPTNRLLEGDVGSGKTVVAAVAAYATFINGFDILVAAPTEILAFQHQKTLKQILSPYNINVGIWTGSKKNKGQITCGTHALLTTYKTDRQVGLIVVDEQHRFGVAQRSKLFLEQAALLTPHLLTMTATPIPRTLALTLYGDLDLSILDEIPKGRQKVSTFIVPNHKRNDAYKFIEAQIDKERQAFVITPFVEASETMVGVRSAINEFEKLKNIFPKYIKLGLLHGRLKSKEKEVIINKFKQNKIQVLVSTPVVEVGIDVPNATVMIIESAERFGLAQLHQLRGRVGRGEYKSYCLLFTDSNAANSIKRLKSMEKVYLGFELAEIDFKMRGPGEFFGLKQSGFINFKIANLSDHKLIKEAQSAAWMIANEDSKLSKYPKLADKISQFQSGYIQPN